MEENSVLWLSHCGIMRITALSSQSALQDYIIEENEIVCGLW